LEVDAVRRWLLVGVLGPLLLVGCGGAEESGRPVAVPKALPGSPPEVEAALLTVEDLGDGWVDTGPTPFEQRGFRSCPATNVLTAEEDPSRLGEAQTYFQEGDEPPAPAFHESVSLWKSEQVAQERLATLATATTTCIGVAEQTPDGTEATVTFTERPVPTLGDEAVGQSARFDFADRPDATIDVMAVRLDDVIVLTIGERHDANAQASLSTARLEELTRKAVQKVQRNIPSS
jgi:hypothetical protein